MAGRATQAAASRTRPPRRPGAPHRDPPDFRVVLVPPATPEEEEDAERRWIEAVEWLVTLGALDA